MSRKELGISFKDGKIVVRYNDEILGGSYFNDCKSIDELFKEALVDMEHVRLYERMLNHVKH